MARSHAGLVPLSMKSDDTAPRAQGRIVELDGVRGLAALSVVAAHYFGEAPHGLAALTVGWIGVDVFFVLSGFLIGSIILGQHDRPSFLTTFYRKRFARIVPVYGAVCVMALIAAALTAQHSWSARPFPPGVYAIFGANFAMSLTNSAGDVWLRPTWTLDVEEQFYLLLPLLMCATPRKLLAPLLLAAWGMATLFRLAWDPLHPVAALTLLPCRMDLLLAGVLLALLHRSLDLRRHLLLMRLLPLLALVALVPIHVLFGQAIFTLVSGAILSIGIAGFLGAVVCGAPEGRRFRSPVLRYFGQISYCLYLVHQPVSGLLHGLILDATPDVGSLAAIAVTVLAFAASVGIAAASWKWFEQPIIAWAHRGQLAPTPAAAPI